jgi:hypothetical protein
MAIITDDLLHYPEVLHYAVVKMSAAQQMLERAPLGATQPPK